MSPASLSTPPDKLVDELLTESNDAGARAVAEAERVSLLAARDAAADRRKRAIDLYTRAKLSEDEFDAVAADVERKNYKPWTTAWPASNPTMTRWTTPSPRMCCRRFRKRLEGGLSDAERQEIVQLLVRRITVHTTVPEHGRKQVRVVIDYRFPPVVQTRTGIAASHGYNLSRVIVA